MPNGETVVDVDRPLRVAVLFSGGASAARYLLEEAPCRGTEYRLVAGFTDVPDAPGVSALRTAGVPVETNDLDAFYAERDTTHSDMRVRAAFDAETRSLLSPYDPDVLLLSGYMRLVTAPLIDAWPAFNVHPGDLTVTRDGERVYTGLDAVRDAVTAGEEATYSCVHLVTSDVDAGPEVVRSAAVPVHRALVDTLLERDAENALRAYVEAHQEYQKWVADGPAVAAAVGLAADGRVERDGGRVTVDDGSGYHQL